MNADKAIGLVMEDLILYSIIKEIDPCLLDHIQLHYQLKMAAGHRLMVIKDNSFSNIPKFIE